MPAWGDFTGLNRGYVLELYEQVPPGPVVGRRGHAGAVRAVDAAGRRDRRGGADLGRVAAQGGRRGQPGAVDPALRPPRGAGSIRSGCASRSAIRRCSPENHGITDDDLRALPASLISSPLADGRLDHVRGRRGVPAPLLLDHRLRLRARVRARGAALAAARGGVRAVPRAGRSDRSDRAARSADAGRGVRALPAPHRFPARRASRSRAST